MGRAIARSVHFKDAANGRGFSCIYSHIAGCGTAPTTPRALRALSDVRVTLARDGRSRQYVLFANCEIEFAFALQAVLNTYHVFARTFCFNSNPPNLEAPGPRSRAIIGTLTAEECTANGGHVAVTRFVIEHCKSPTG